MTRPSVTRHDGDFKEENNGGADTGQIQEGKKRKQTIFLFPTIREAMGKS